MIGSIFKFRLSRSLSRNGLFLLIAGIFIFSGADSEALEVKKFIPPLEETIRLAEGKNVSGDSSGELVFRVKNLYYQIQSAREQLAISREVKGHFDKAVEKSEEKYDAGEEDISQSDITKLKLGLAGTRNDIIELETEIRIAKLSLGKYLGWTIAEDEELAEGKIVPVEFEFKDFGEFIAKMNNPHNTTDGDRKFVLEKAFYKVTEARGKMELAKETRKITRALLVTEVANYDFGIGSSGDLFEALIIYTRVLKGFYQSVFNYNMAVAELYR